MQSKMLNYLLGTTSKVEILRVLYESDDAMTGRRIASTAGISPRSCQLSLDSLVKNKALFRKAVGRAYSYTLNREHRVVWELLKPLFEQERALHKDVTSLITRASKPFGESVISVFWRLNQERKSEAAQLVIIVDDKKKGADKEVVKKLEDEIEARFGFTCKTDIVVRADFATKFLANDAARKRFARDFIKVRGLAYNELVA